MGETRPCESISAPVDCSICHAEQVEQHSTSVHGELAAKGDPDAPTCLDCHEKHTTQSHRLPTSRTFARNVPELCGTCHRKGEAAAERIESVIPDIVESFIQSAHGKGLLESGLVVSASCVDCHMSPTNFAPAQHHVHTHTFRFLEPSLAVDAGMPSSCTVECHRDRNAHWSADVLADWRDTE